MPSISAKQADLARATPLAQRITVRYAEAAVLSGLPVSKLQAAVASGALRSAKVGRSRLIVVKSLVELLERAQSHPLTKEGLPLGKRQVHRGGRP